MGMENSAEKQIKVGSIIRDTEDNKLYKITEISKKVAKIDMTLWV